MMAESRMRTRGLVPPRSWTMMERFFRLRTMGECFLWSPLAWALRHFRCTSLHEKEFVGIEEYPAEGSEAMLIQVGKGFFGFLFLR